MSAERTLAIFDPDRHLCEALGNMFKAFGHEVVVFAYTAETAKNVVDALSPGDCDVFLVNGEMTQHAGTYEEGEALARTINTRGLGTVIGISLEGLDAAPQNAVPGDVNVLLDLVNESVHAPLDTAA
jgi:hypothetical protein